MTNEKIEELDSWLRCKLAFDNILANRVLLVSSTRDSYFFGNHKQLMNLMLLLIQDAESLTNRDLLAFPEEFEANSRLLKILIDWLCLLTDGLIQYNEFTPSYVVTKHCKEIIAIELND